MVCLQKLEAADLIFKLHGLSQDLPQNDQLVVTHVCMYVLSIAIHETTYCVSELRRSVVLLCTNTVVCNCMYIAPGSTATSSAFEILLQSVHVIANM